MNGPHTPSWTSIHNVGILLIMAAWAVPRGEPWVVRDKIFQPRPEFKIKKNMFAFLQNLKT